MGTRITELLGIKYPIFQGAMARIADASLAAAVSNAGGLGIIATSGLTTELVRNEIRKAKELTKNPFGVNVMLLSENVAEIVDLICEEKVQVVTTGAGNPGKYIEKFKSNNIKVIPVIPSVAIAKKMEKLGVDAVIAEGMESGGHIGKLTTMVLVPQVVDALTIPVLAAGGIACGRGLGASFMLGAEGVQIGTRFLVATECNIHDNYKDSIIKANDIDTTITGKLTGHPVRALKNKLTRQLEELEFCRIEDKEEAIRKFEELGKGALKRAVVDGDIEFGSLMGGQISGLVTKRQSCSEIIEEIVSEYQSKGGII